MLMVRTDDTADGRNTCSQQVRNRDRRDDQNNRNDDQQFDESETLRRQKLTGAKTRSFLLNSSPGKSRDDSFQKTPWVFEKCTFLQESICAFLYQFWAIVLGQAGKNDHRDVRCQIILFQRAKHLGAAELG